MTDLLERITEDPSEGAGRACIRTTQIRVTDVLGLLACGLEAHRIPLELPDLELEDVEAALEYAIQELERARPEA